MPQTNPAECGRSYVFRPKRHEIGRLRAFTKIVERVYLRAGVAKRRNAPRPGQCDRVFQRNDGVIEGRLDVVGHGYRVRADGGVQVILARPVVVTGVDKGGPRKGVAAVEHVAVALLDDDLVLHACGVGELGDPVGVVARHAGGDAEGLRRGSARRDEGRLDSQEVGDEVA